MSGILFGVGIFFGFVIGAAVRWLAWIVVPILLRLVFREIRKALVARIRPMVLRASDPNRDLLWLAVSVISSAEGR